MRRDDYLIFGSCNTKDYSVGIFGDQLANAPQRSIDVMSVPGKNGDVLIDNGRYENITVSYKAYIIDEYNLNIRGLRSALLAQHGYQKLEDSVNPEEYRMGYILPFEIEESGILRAGQFTLQFNCKPQRYLKVGDYDITLTSSGSIHSDYDEDAAPLIRAYGTGYFSINGVRITINSANSYTDIDCELMEAYKDTMATNCNGNITVNNNKFPVLSKGNNTITISGLSRLDIKPRWWII